MKFSFLKDVAIADIAFRAEGKTKEELFANCAMALTSAMADTRKMGAQEKRKISIAGKDDNELLYSFLSELVYIKDVDGLLFKDFKISLAEGGLDAECGGDKLESIGRENLNNDVKAITMYLFGIKKGKGKFAATVVVDI
ncbi:MAG: archease [Candidatus Diapherotrites archaeon]|uniref:Archease n=1 Tax=Candidatus Iainarchaeum sp. TaxID=3101447 RepID=A0A8T3YJ65_9ARCH|nr:archease [Candidatus Diapherotrites archaeon]